jgi:hypothetical protein
MFDDNARVKELAEGLVAQYRSLRHDVAVAMLDDYVAEHGTKDLPAVWHHLARVIADVYTTANMAVMRPDSEPSPDDPYAVYDHHARHLVILCQENQVDAYPTVAAYQTQLDDRGDVQKGIVLCLSHLVSEGE